MGSFDEHERIIDEITEELENLVEIESLYKHFPYPSPDYQLGEIDLLVLRPNNIMEIYEVKTGNGLRHGRKQLRKAEKWFKDDDRIPLQIEKYLCHPSEDHEQIIYEKI